MRRRYPSWRDIRAGVLLFVAALRWTIRQVAEERAAADLDAAQLRQETRERTWKPKKRDLN